MRDTSEAALLTAAQRGDEQAFVALTSAHRGAVHALSYRLLGSLHDADDAQQETLLRAWQGIGGYRPRAPLAAWLHRIATNVCLRMIERRARTPTPVDAHLEPYPDQLLHTDPHDGSGDPALAAVRRETIGLAFIAAMQLLPPKQRAVLVLREVLDWSAREVAETLDDTVPAVNSALQRARARLDQEGREGTLARRHRPLDRATETAVMQRFQHAWDAVDIGAIVNLLTDDALLTMPPEDIRVHGAREVGGFFATAPAGGRLDRILLREVQANCQPALAAYADEDATGEHRAYGVMVFAIDGERIAGITGFPRQPDLFARLGLPTLLSNRLAG